jgi:hypothetical protein
LTVNTEAALVGDLGLGHLDRIASTFNGVLGGATTNHVTLKNKDCVNYLIGMCKKINSTTLPQ